MIRFGKRLAKSPISLFRLKEDAKYHRFCCEVKDQEIDELLEELDAKNEVLSAIAKSDAAPIPRAVGAYYIVTKDEYDAKNKEIARHKATVESIVKEVHHRDKLLSDKDAKIAEMESELKAKGEDDASWESRCHRIVNDHNKLFATFINERSANAEKDDEIAKLRRAADEARAELRKAKRLHSNEAAYDADAVNGFSDDTTEKLAALAQQVLDNAGKVSFAAACAVVLKRRLDDAKRCNASLAQRYAEEAKNLKEARDYIFKMGQRNWLPDQFLAPWGDASEWTIVNHADGSSSFYKQGQFRDPYANGNNGK